MQSKFSEILKKERLNRKLTQQQLADLVNDRLNSELENDTLINQKIKNISEYKVSRVSISRYENGKREPELDILYALADVLGIQFDYLLGKSQLKSHSSQLMLKDISYLIELTDKETPEFSKLISNIIDTCFLTINEYTKKQNIKVLQVIHDLYRSILEINLEHKTLYTEEQYTIKGNIDDPNRKFSMLLNKLIDEITKSTTNY